MQEPNVQTVMRALTYFAAQLTRQWDMEGMAHQNCGWDAEPQALLGGSGSYWVTTSDELVTEPRTPPPPCISYANVRNYYGPYAHCSLDKAVACAKHIQLPTQTCARAWYGCTLTSAHISKCMQTQDSLGNMKISGSHPCWHKQ